MDILCELQSDLIYEWPPLLIEQIYSRDLFERE